MRAAGSSRLIRRVAVRASQRGMRMPIKLFFELLREPHAIGSAVVLVTHEAALAARAQRHLVMTRGALAPAE